LACYTVRSMITVTVDLSADLIVWQPVHIEAVAAAQRNRGGGPVTSAEVLKVRPDLARSAHDLTERGKRIMTLPPLLDGRYLVLHSYNPQNMALWAVMR
jgi:hypothetical protein